MGPKICYNANVVICYLEKTKVFYTLFEEGKNISFFKSGGKIDIVAYPKKLDEAISLLQFLIENNVPYKILGNGSNTLITDSGYKGVVVSLKKLCGFSLEENLLTALSGTPLPLIATITEKNGLLGLQPLSGIPCSLGGALLKNAGCYAQEISSLVKEVTVFDLQTLKTVTLQRQSIPYSYRSSGGVFENKVILQATLELSRTPSAYIQTNQYYRNKRLKSQPSLPSLGSVFLKTMLDVPAAIYIENAGLKGFRIGGAEISKKHANFIVNNGNAKSKDYLDLMNLVKSVVKKRYNVILKEEIDVIGEI